MDDLTIVELYFQRKESAIQETDKKYGRLCFDISIQILCNNEDSEECVNDTYLSVWNVIPPTRPNSFRAFISKITRNLSLKKLDYNHAQKRNSDVIVSFNEIENILPDNKIRPDVDNQEISKLISKFLCREKESVRNVFIRRYWFCDPISDIADRYAYSESKVKSMLYHTRNKLREYLKKEGIEI